MQLCLAAFSFVFFRPSRHKNCPEVPIYLDRVFGLWPRVLAFSPECCPFYLCSCQLEGLACVSQRFPINLESSLHVRSHQDFRDKTRLKGGAVGGTGHAYTLLAKKSDKTLVFFFKLEIWNFQAQRHGLIICGDTARFGIDPKLII